MDLTPNTQPGHCHCGCGQFAPIAKRSNAAKGWVKGQPLRFVLGHMGGINATKTYQAKLAVAPDGTPTKLCTWCKRQRPLNGFDVSQWRPDRLRSHCRSCHNEQEKERYRRNPAPRKLSAIRARKKARSIIRARIARIRASGCRLCPERDPCCIEFHHLTGKDRCVTHCESIPELERELVKCVVLCANCHRKAHAGHIFVSIDLLCESTEGKEAA
jgi:hypothetical protein